MDIPKAGNGKRGEKGYLGYLLRQAAAAHRLRMDRALADLNITQPQFAVLTMLANYPGASNADIARLALLTPQTMSFIVGNLLQADLLVRRPHAVHGRIHLLDLTAKGSDVLEQAKAIVINLESEITWGFSPEEIATVRRWLVNSAVQREL